MSSGIFIVRKKNGKNIAVELADPPQGKGWLVVPVKHELHDKISRLDPDGFWEEELSNALGGAIEQFFATRPVHVNAPKAQVARPSLKLYDARDPLKERIN